MPILSKSYKAAQKSPIETLHISSFVNGNYYYKWETQNTLVWKLWRLSYGPGLAINWF